MRNWLLLGMLAGCSLFATTALAVDWTAYNDTHPWNVDPPNPPNTTEWGLGSVATSNTGLLKDETGANTGVTVTVIGTGVSLNGTGADVPLVGDANALFAGKVDMNDDIDRLIYYGSDNWTVDLVFTDLDPSKKYTMASLHNRGKDYPDRWSVISISDADSYTYAASAGAHKVNDSTVTLVADQTNLGYVAKWTDIDPGADRDFTITYTHSKGPGDRPAGSSQNGNKAYGPAGFMLVQVPEPASMCLLASALLGIGLVGLLRRRRRRQG